MSEKNTHKWLGDIVYTSISSKKILIAEQQVSNTSPLFELAKITNTPRLKP
jgi:hypothetical protein